MPKLSAVTITDELLRTMMRGDVLTDSASRGLTAWRGANDVAWTLRWKDADGQHAAVNGRWPAVSVDAARGIAALERHRVADGNRPDAVVRSEARKSVVKAAAVPTVGEVWTGYLTGKLATSRKDKGRALNLIIERDIGKLRDVRADKVTPAAAKAILDKILARGARSMAAQFRDAMGAAWRHAHQMRTLGREIDDPFAGLMRQGSKDLLALVPKAERFRVADWKAWLRWLPESGISPTMQRLFILQALTGARVGEIISARIQQIEANEDGSAWLRTHFKRAPRNIHLSNAAMRVVAHQREQWPSRDWLFPSERSATGHILAMAAVTAILRVRERCPIKLRDPRSNELVD
jgi:integrase